MIKQVIAIRKDLNMRKGKMVVQGAHAAIQSALLADKLTYKSWEACGTKKICIGVDSEAELIELYQMAKDEGMPCALIRDAGLTEFKEPTLTAIAIGPYDSREIDLITGMKKLL